MTEAIFIHDVSRTVGRPLLHIGIVYVKDDWNEQELFSEFPQNGFWVSEQCWDFVANQILQRKIDRTDCKKQSYVVISNRVSRNREYAENVVRHLVKKQKEKQDCFYIVSKNPFAVLKAWRQGFSFVKIGDKKRRRMLYETID